MTFIPSVISEIDNNNTSSSNLSSSAVYNGTTSQTNGFNSIDITINSDQSSSAGGIVVQISDDGITFLTYLTDSYFANTVYTRSIKVLKKYYKVIYTNGTVATNTFSLTTRLSVESPSNSHLSNTIYTTINDPMNDAFGKLRVSNPYTLLDLQIPGYTGPNDFRKNNLLMCYETNNNYTTTPNFSFLTLSGTGSGYQINQSRKYCNYQPGKSLLFLSSAVIYESGPTVPTATSDYQNRLGFFDDKNGLFFEFDSKEGISVVRRDNEIDTKVYQSDWNVDKLDGTGVSGYNLDFTKTQLFIIDFEWLGVGRIRFGFYIYGIIYYCHQITNVNTLTAPYMRTPNLPVRYEIRGNNASQTDTVSMRQICSTVISEGGFNPIGYPFTISNNTTGISVTTSETPLLVLLGNTTYNYYHENIIPTSFNIFTSDSSIVLYRLRLYLAPDSPGTLETLINVNSNSRSAYTTTITSFTPSNSIIVDQGYASGKNLVQLGNLTDVFSNFTQITSNINNVSDIFVLTAQTVSGSTTVYSSLNFTEAY
jgi:hypothetical protein